MPHDDIDLGLGSTQTKEIISRNFPFACVCTPCGGLVAMNGRLQQRLNHDFDDTAGVTFFDLLKENDISEAREAIEAQLAGETGSAACLRLKAPGTGYAWMEFHFFRASGSRNISALAKDVTEYHRLRIRSQMVDEMIGVGTWEMSSPDEGIVWSESLFSLYGIEGERCALSSEEALRNFPDPGRQVLRKAFQALFRDLQPFDLTLPFLSRNGRDLHVRVTGRPEIKNGAFVRAYGVVIDATEQILKQEQLKSAEQAASEAMSNFEEAVELLPDGFVLYDENDCLVHANTSYRSIYATSAAAVNKGASFEEILRYGLAKGQYRDAIGR